MNEKVIFTDQKNRYQLCQDEIGNLYISVVCGGIGLYEIKFKLNEEEVEYYRKFGKKSLDDLSYNVAKNTEFYLERVVKA